MSQEFKEYETGARRSPDCENCDLSLIPPSAMFAWGRAFADGASKYGRDNWLMGMPQASVINHALTHLYKYLAGDTSEDHLGHAIWNVGVAIHQQQHRPDMLDLPNYTGTTTESPAEEPERCKYLAAMEAVKAYHPNACCEQTLAGSWRVRERSGGASLSGSHKCESDAWIDVYQRIRESGKAGGQ